MRHAELPAAIDAGELRVELHFSRAVALESLERCLEVGRLSWERREADDDLWIEPSYAFVSPQTGATVTGDEKAMRNDLKGADLPQPGTRLAIMYLDDRSHRML